MTTLDAPPAVWSGLTACRQPLDLRPEAFGMLRDSASLCHDPAALRERMQEDGYLYLPGALHRSQVMEARAELLRRIGERGYLRANGGEDEAATEMGSPFMPDLAEDNAPLDRVIHDGPMMEIYARLLGGEVRYFEFTWIRTVGPGGSTAPHCDSVYMNRGTHQLFTSWTPYSDISPQTGGLMVLEKSHRIDRLREHYGQKDVDKFCTNRREEGRNFMGGGGNIATGGTLSHRPVQLREALGGRWLTAPYRMGDVLIFSIFTVHGSTDNRSDRIRLSSDTRYQLASEPADERWVGEHPIAHGPEAKRGMIC